MTERTQRRLAAIVSTDVVGYSRLMGVDEIGTLDALRKHRTELIDPLIAQRGGRVVKTMGDGLLLEFPSVVNATRCAIEVQQGMAERNEGVDEGKRITFRIGVNLGDIIIEGEDILGDGVNIAARLQEIAEPGGVSISIRVYEDVRRQLRRKDPRGTARGGSDVLLQGVRLSVRIVAHLARTAMAFSKNPLILSPGQLNEECWIRPFAQFPDPQLASCRASRRGEVRAPTRRGLPAQVCCAMVGIRQLRRRPRSAARRQNAVRFSATASHLGRKRHGYSR
jgi:class 3 adenylate cyclase